MCSRGDSFTIMVLIGRMAMVCIRETQCSLQHARCVYLYQDFAILDYRVNMRLDSLPVAEMATFAYEVRT
jgi:hypothetical protein